MKDLIKNLLRESLINEKLANVDSDVDLIYDKYFKKSIDYISRTGLVKKDLFPRSEYNTMIFKTPEAIKAHEMNMCVIEINTTYGNFYNPKDRIIGFGVNFAAIDYIIDEFEGNFQAAANSLDGPQRHSLLNEFTPERIKGSIHHELAHWIDDTLHNGHISKRLDKAKEVNSSYIDGISINSTKIEIEGQIHNIKQLYNKYKDTWDTLTFNDLMNLSPPINFVFRQLKRDVKVKWLRDLKTRMHREGLLGKNMINN